MHVPWQFVFLCLSNHLILSDLGGEGGSGQSQGLPGEQHIFCRRPLHHCSLCIRLGSATQPLCSAGLAPPQPHGHHTRYYCTWLWPVQQLPNHCTFMRWELSSLGSGCMNRWQSKARCTTRKTPHRCKDVCSNRLSGTSYRTETICKGVALVLSSSSIHSSLSSSVSYLTVGFLWPFPSLPLDQNFLQVLADLTEVQEKTTPSFYSRSTMKALGLVA